MARGSFAHTERPQGNPGPMHRTKALDALSALAKRGGANINAEQLQRPMPDKKLAQQPQLKMPSPVAVEAMSRSQQQPQMQPQQGMAQGMAQPMGMPMGQAPMQQPMQPQAQPIPASPAELEFQPPPVEGYYGQLLAKTIAEDPYLRPGERDWRHDALDKFAQIRAKLDAVRAYVNSGDPQTVKGYVREKRLNARDV